MVTDEGKQNQKNTTIHIEDDLTKDDLVTWHVTRDPEKYFSFEISRFFQIMDPLTSSQIPQKPSGIMICG
jgi:hypothetical protein